MKKLKPANELRYTMPLHPTEVGSSIRFLLKNNIDFDVFLPTKGFNLQRELVWNINQKRELILSIFIGRHIPHISYINKWGEDNSDIYQIIDGKQRLSTIFEFYNNKFTIYLEGEEWFFKDLPEDYQSGFLRTHLRGYVVNEEKINGISDQLKIDWFSFINFAGTPQDSEHLRKLKNGII